MLARFLLGVPCLLSIATDMPLLMVLACSECIIRPVFLSVICKRLKGQKIEVTSLSGHLHSVYWDILDPSETHIYSKGKPACHLAFLASQRAEQTPQVSAFRREE